MDEAGMGGLWRFRPIRIISSSCRSSRDCEDWRHWPEILGEDHIASAWEDWLRRRSRYLGSEGR